SFLVPQSSLDKPPILRYSGSAYLATRGVRPVAVATRVERVALYRRICIGGRRGKKPHRGGPAAPGATKRPRRPPPARHSYLDQEQCYDRLVTAQRRAGCG